MTCVNDLGKEVFGVDDLSQIQIAFLREWGKFRRVFSRKLSLNSSSELGEYVVIEVHTRERLAEKMSKAFGIGGVNAVAVVDHSKVLYAVV